jgi:hypothetical protein
LLQTYARNEIFPVYLKTGQQSNFDSIKKIGYTLFLREDLLEILNDGHNAGITDSIFEDFRNYLHEIDNAINSFSTLPVKDWHWDSWKGFYSLLQKELGEGGWDYVPQRNGGFLGFWWYFGVKDSGTAKYEYYLQLEHNKFCFKISPYKREDAEDVRNHYRPLLMSAALKHGIAIHQNGRIGKSMTVAALTNPCIQTDSNGILNMEKTIECIRKVQKMLDDV